MNTKKNPGKRIFSFASAAALIALLFLAIVALGQEGQDEPDGNNGNFSAAESSADMPFMLLQVQADLQGSLNDLDLDVENASQALSVTGLEGTAARGVLRKLLESDSNLAQAATFSKEGKIIVAEGERSEGAEGADISRQEHIAHVLRTKTPTLSKQFLLVEGYNATALVYPVFSPQGEFIGGISAIIEPDKLMSILIASQLQSDIYSQSSIAITNTSFWLMDLNGLLLYDEDPSQIGKNLFEDPLYKPYPSLLELVGQRIVIERAGHGYYNFFEPTEGNETIVYKECYWTTAGLHSREWRLVITRII